ncbi:hypothetical protein FOZ60_004206 [Perkinsus olseni]|uniref:subtilisin n=1 Tax=Perkinsus olseni TaxID=32597 RepID=A0A7J6NTW0_PEROL|nr:hypothetical protein FOZ60_004206 [Perkinsus olseni]
MAMRSAFLLTIFLYVVALGEGLSNRTLVEVSHRGVPLDIRQVPLMVAQAAAASGGRSNLEVIRIGPAWVAARAAKQKLKDIVLAISDTGVDMTHPDLVNQFWKDPVDGSIGYNFITKSSDVTDDNGHGTHNAGNAAAQTNNSLGIAGVANVNGATPNVKLMILKFLDAGGSGWGSDALSALNYAVKHGATISSHSYGAYSPSQVFEDAFKNASAKNHVAVVAAGNDGSTLNDTHTYPCCFAVNISSMLCVAASTSATTNVTLAYFSNAGNVTKIAAPGVHINSTYPGGYGPDSGTSMSTPTVAGVAALLATLGLEGQEITDAIVQSKTAGVPNNFNLTHIGELDALNAVHVALGQPTSPPRPSKHPGRVRGF